ncbi:MAG: hypothetical protein CVU97_01175 [Firmicutes bacterium HGW-Firmicutes-21]|nr:MAG: hypothetical protein CVU97_01175 [Firmicutes bacterium HGW-Firmicutes-21]
MPLTFFGGITPENKKYSRISPLRFITPPETIYIPVDGEITPMVTTKDIVSVGQTVAYSGETPVYSSVSGVVKGIAREGEKRYLAIGNDRKNTPYESLRGVQKPLGELSLSEISALLKQYAIFDGSDGIPLYDKLAAVQNGVELKRIIINCCEHDSYSTALYRLLCERPKELIGGAKILMHALSIKKCIIVIENIKRNVIKKLEKHINDSDMFVSAYIAQKYPINDKTIISAIYGSEIPHGKDAGSLGYVFFGAEAVIQVFNSFVSGIPQVTKTITVSGESIANPSNLIVPLGTPIKHLIEDCGGLSHRCKCVVNGGVMNGEYMETPGGVVTAGTNQLLFLRWIDKYGGNCILCGRCITVCPMHLSPLDYATTYEKRDKPNADNTYYGISACIECGCCEFICPTGVPLLEIIRNGKKSERTVRKRKRRGNKIVLGSLKKRTKDIVNTKIPSAFTNNKKENINKNDKDDNINPLDEDMFVQF